MNKITGIMYITRDQAQFILRSGYLKRNSVGNPLQYSVNLIEIDQLCTNVEDDNNNKSFQWKNIKFCYKSHLSEYDIIFYLFCTKH